MPRRSFESEYLYGLHDAGGEQIMLDKGIPGWVLVTEKLGSNPNDQGGGNYRYLSDRGLAVMVRLNNGYEEDGTLPFEARYADFAQRCANFVRNSDGAHIWIIGNEPNYAIEWPGARWDWNTVQPVSPDKVGEPITPQRYAKCFIPVRKAIKALPGHNDDLVLPAAVAPWNAMTRYPGNEKGDWVRYFVDMLRAIGADNLDGITLHTYTHGQSEDQIWAEDKQDAEGYRHLRKTFRTYRDFIDALPANMRRLPLYLTEINPHPTWEDRNTKWVQRAYGEIDYWNKNNPQKIRCVILFRWTRADQRWGFEGKNGVIDDFRQALDFRYRWEVGAAPEPDEPVVIDAPYRAEITWKRPLSKGQTGQQTPVVVLVRNTGSSEWPSGGGNPVRLGYHWYTAAGAPVTDVADNRVFLPRNLKPGDSVELTIPVGMPGQPGTYTLDLDMVHENITWFANAGSQVLRTAVNVEGAPLPSEQYFPETKTWVRGVFLDFYRRYGLDLCGYPITEQFTENGMAVQYFQRLALEEHEKGKVRLRLTASQAWDADKKLAALQQQVALLTQRLQQGGGAAPRPEIQDVIAQLPRDPAGLLPRADEQSKYIIIHHTGIPSGVSVQRVAQVYRQKNWPAITGHFYVDYDGALLQTGALTEAVSAAAWAQEGINILVAGNFTETTPSPAQIDALAALCAWLLDSHGLETAAVRGLGEGFSPTQSPGKQWLSGQRWKEMLVQRIEPLRGSGGTVAPAPDGGALAALRQQIEQARQESESLRGQLAQIKAERDQFSAQASVLGGQVAALTGQVAALQAEISALRLALAQATKTVIAQPPVRDVIGQLPRDAAKMVKRTTADIRYIVLNHTAVPASVGIDRVAKAHRARWPAFVSQFFVDGEGAILQTNPIDEVVDDKQPWLFHGVNIHVAGNFNDAIPTPAQLDALAALVAWLQQSYDIPSENVKGVREFIVTQSPGEQWQAAGNWKQVLLERVEAVRAAAQPGGAQPGGGTGAGSEVIQTLRQQIAALQTQNRDLAAQLATARAQLQALPAENQQLRQQIGQLQAQVQDLKQKLEAANNQLKTLPAETQTLKTQIAQLQTQNKDLAQQLATAKAQLEKLPADSQALRQQIGQLQTQVQALGQQLAAAQTEAQTLRQENEKLRTQPHPGGPAIAPKPAMQELVDKLPKHPTNRYPARTLAQITHIAIHHSAAPANIPPERIALYHVNNPQHQWPGIGYHYYIGPDGTIYHTQDLTLASNHVYKNNGYTVGICVAGDFTEVAPTPAQLDAAARLTAWLMQELKIPLGHVWGHKEFPDNVTACPGRQWSDGQKWKDSLFAHIARARGEAGVRPLNHYLLFWQKPEAWAQQDWAGAMNYIARFRPTAGFSLDDARQSEYVTIVGGVAGVSQQAEDELRRAGVKVERLAGRDFAETKSMLDGLAQSGKRFATL
jgi:N-acetyl-anhydromuramyl-L-alanine amidase AmpD/predicted  nucleic acid-binding Zn-ribbon protein